MLHRLSNVVLPCQLFSYIDTEWFDFKVLFVACGWWLARLRASSYLLEVLEGPWLLVVILIISKFREKAIARPFVSTE